jgi:hypothetical protein
MKKTCALLLLLSSLSAWAAPPAKGYILVPKIAELVQIGTF